MAFLHSQAKQILAVGKRIAQISFTKHLLLTNTCICVGLGSAGDLLQQRYELFHGNLQHWDVRRTQHIFLTNCFLGPMCHYWYILLERLFTGHSYKMLAKKVFVDQLIFSPVYIVVFFSMLSLLERSSVAAGITDVKTKGWQIFKAECLLWPPIQILNFWLVPLRFRVLYDNTVSMGFDVFYSRVKYSRVDTTATNVNWLHTPVSNVNWLIPILCVLAASNELAVISTIYPCQFVKHVFAFMLCDRWNWFVL